MGWNLKKKFKRAKRRIKKQFHKLDDKYGPKALLGGGGAVSSTPSAADSSLGSTGLGLVDSKEEENEEELETTARKTIKKKKRGTKGSKIPLASSASTTGVQI